LRARWHFDVQQSSQRPWIMSISTRIRETRHVVNLTFLESPMREIPAPREITRQWTFSKSVHSPTCRAKDDFISDYYFYECNLLPF